MAKYLFVYYGGKMEKSMAAWNKWFAGLGKALIDGGAPTQPGKIVSSDGVKSIGTKPVTGYSILQADSLDGAIALAIRRYFLATGWLKSVQEATLARCRELLPELYPNGHPEGREFICGGEVEGGDGRSCKVNTRTGKWADFAASGERGQSGSDLISLYAAAKHVDYKVALRELAERYGVSRGEWAPVVPIPPECYNIVDGEPSLPDLAEARGCTGYWSYRRNAGGDTGATELLCFRVRFDRANGKKDIKPLTYSRNSETGESAWTWRDLPDPLPLYGLEALCAGEISKLLIVEGEKTARAARGLLPDWCVITWAGGSGRVKHADWTPVISLPAGVRIVCWPDNDKPGSDAMESVSASVGRRVEIVIPDPEWPAGYDLADLDMDGWDTDRTVDWITRHSRAVEPPEPVLERPEVDLTGKDYFLQMNRVFEAVKLIKAEMYWCNERLVEVRRNAYGYIVIEEIRAREFADWSVKYLKTVAQQKYGPQPCPMNENLASAVVRHARTEVPVLRRFAFTPIFAQAGKILETPGYHAESQVYLDIPSDYDPSMTAESARELVLDLIADFPFETESDRTMALAFPLTAILRDMIGGPTPMFRFEAPAPGTGKSKLCRVLAEIITPFFGAQTLSESDEEVRKAITTALSMSPPLVVFDNVDKPERLESQHIKIALSEDIWQDRLLGSNTQITVPIRNLWAVTLNNPLLSPEIFRRSVRVRLNAKVEHPEARSGWRHEAILDYARANRGKLLSAFVALARFGLGGTCDAHMGSYEQWVNVVGGCLNKLHQTCAKNGEFAQFLGTLEEDRKESADQQSEGLSQFIETWKVKVGKKPVSITTLAEIGQTIDGLPVRRDSSGKVSSRSLGKFLKRHRGMVVGGATIYGPVHTRDGSVCWLGGDFSNDPEEHLGETMGLGFESL